MSDGDVSLAKIPDRKEGWRARPRAAGVAVAAAELDSAAGSWVAAAELDSAAGARAATAVGARHSVTRLANAAAADLGAVQGPL